MSARDAIPQASELVPKASELMHSELASNASVGLNDTAR